MPFPFTLCHILPHAPNHTHSVSLLYHSVSIPLLTPPLSSSPSLFLSLSLCLHPLSLTHSPSLSPPLSSSPSLFLYLSLSLSLSPPPSPSLPPLFLYLPLSLSPPPSLSLSLFLSLSLPLSPS